MENIQTTINNPITNQCEVQGIVLNDPILNHEVKGEKFYKFFIECERTSGTVDTLPVQISERLMLEDKISKGDQIKIEGEFRSYNNFTGEGPRCILTVFAKSWTPTCEASSNPNHIILDGFVCKQPVFRTTPFGREITDLLIAVNRPYNKSDYLPAIVWGRNAKFADTLPVGQHIKLDGRIQSRTYIKHHEDGSEEERTAYEISVNSIKAIDYTEDADVVITGEEGTVE